MNRRARRVIFAVVMSIMILSLQSMTVYSAEILYGVNELKEKYRQNEYLEIMSTIINNETRPLTLVKFNVTIINAKKIGGEIRVAKSIVKDLEKIQIEHLEAFSVYLKIPLRDLAPDKYNLTAFFICYYDPLHEQNVTVLKDFKFQLLPSIEIPPAAIFVAFIMSAIIIIYVGYGIAGRVKGRFKKK